ncbi:MAG: LysM peptidoglycan-binding domain-containing protein [Bacteroidales bacterium]|nr:LysM peptidoglycan-binding domain-containing protein [Bacteroidales bacterium]MCF8336531.1 LysM peptidoglycan-binding domain-containing protein [Bacteroidales bacterium]
MDINSFLRLIKKNLLLLIGVPLILAASVYFFSRDQPKSYSSETVVFTGIGSGYSAEKQTRTRISRYGTNMQFDNVIKIINSRSTKEQTAIRLLAQHLCMEKPIPKYISKDQYNQLQNIVPEKVKDLVVKYGKTGAERDRLEEIKQKEKRIEKLNQELQQEKERIQNITSRQRDRRSAGETTQTFSTGDTLLQEQYHTVSYGESLKSIANQYGMTVGELMTLNNLRDTDIKVGNRLLVRKKSQDRQSNRGQIQYKTHTVEDKETLYSIAEQYNVSVNDLKNWNNLTDESIEQGQSLIIGRTETQADTSAGAEQQDEGVAEYSEHVMEDFRFVNPEKKATEAEQENAIIPPGVNVNDYYQTVQNLMGFYQRSDTNFVYELLQYHHPIYSIQAISNARVTRVKNSDFINISYNSKDPGICQQTLKILTNVFIQNYKSLKERQTDQVVNYFQEQVQKASKRLKEVENRLLSFKEKNDLINYEEQTEAIATQKERLDKQYQDIQAQMRAAAASLNKLESNLARKDSIFIKSDLITNKRKELAEVTSKLSVNEVAQDYDKITADRVQELKKRKQELKNELKLYVDQLYSYQQSIEGIPIENLLDQWLAKTMNYEEAKATLEVLEQRKNDFQETYQVFAPLGATKNRIERQINVAEQEYLELLASLNEARMRKQNLEMTSNIKVVDPPYYPLTATSSRTKILILAAGAIGFILVIFVILVLEYFDTSNKTPERITKATNLNLAGAYPSLNIQEENVDFPYVNNRMSEMIIQNLKLRLRYTSIKKPVKPYFVLIFSTQPQAGKTYVGHKIKEKLQEFGSNVLYLNYKPSVDQEYSESEYIYDINNQFFDIEHIRELLDKTALRSDNREYDYIFLEIPNIIHNTYPLDLMRTLDTALLVTRATTTWKKADRMALENFNRVAEEEPMIILNDVEMFVIDEMLHGVPTTGKSKWEKYKDMATTPFRMRVQFKDSEKNESGE